MNRYRHERSFSDEIRPGESPFDAVKRIARRPSPESARVLVRELLTSSPHRRLVSTTLRKRYADIAIPFLVDMVDEAPKSAMVDLLFLLCQLGHPGSLVKLVRTMRPDYTEIEGSRSIIQRTRSLLTNYAQELRDDLFELLGSSVPDDVLLAAKYTYRFDADRTIAALAKIWQSDSVENSVRGSALRLIVSLSPCETVTLLGASDPPLPEYEWITVFRRLLLSDECELDLKTLRHFAKRGDDPRSVVASAFLVDAGESTYTQNVRRWLLKRIDEIEGHDETSQSAFRALGLMLAEAGDRDWIEALRTRALVRDGMDMARRILVGSTSEAGLEILEEELESATDPNDMYWAMVTALKNYRERATRVVEICNRRGHVKLKKRLQELCKEVWPGKTFEQILSVASASGRSQSETDSISSPVTAPGTVRRRRSNSLSIARDPVVPRAVKQAEDDTCQVCGRRLKDVRSGSPYSEAHHVQPLSAGGPDAAENVLCLCPLCHRLFHLGALGIDAELRVVTATGVVERVHPVLSLSDSHRLSIDSFQYHWDTVFFSPPGVRFSIEDDFEHA